MCLALFVVAACDKKPDPAAVPAPTEAAKPAAEAAKPAAEAAKPAPAPEAPKPAPAEVTQPAASADPAAAGPRIGAPAPDFTLPDLDGKPVSLASFRGKTVVLEWYNPDCPFVVKQHQEGPLKDMAKRWKGKDIVWLAINSGAPGKQGHGVERNRASVTEYGLEHPVLLDESGDVGKRYVARNTPHMYVIDPNGILVYAGAIDNAPMGRVPAEGFVNHVEKALEDLAAGRPVALAETRAYGCSVKYPD
jgi:peroxiredoxin